MKLLSRMSAAVLLSFALTSPAFSQGPVEYALILVMVCNDCDTGNGTSTNEVTLEICATNTSSDAIKVGLIYKPASYNPDNSVDEFELVFQDSERGTTICEYYTPPQGPGNLAMVFRGPRGLAGDFDADGIDDIGLWVPSGIAKKIGVVVQVSTVNPDGTRSVLPTDRIFSSYNHFHSAIIPRP